MKDKKHIYHYESRASDFIVRITSCIEGRTSGRMEHCQSGQVVYFRSFLEMVMLIQDKLDEQQYPKASHEMRSWLDDVVNITREVLQFGK